MHKLGQYRVCPELNYLFCENKKLLIIDDNIQYHVNVLTVFLHYMLRWHI